MKDLNASRDRFTENIRYIAKFHETYSKPVPAVVRTTARTINGVRIIHYPKTRRPERVVYVLPVGMNGDQFKEWKQISL